MAFRDQSVDTPVDVHMPYFWTLWRRNQTWRDNLQRRASHKALDIPEEEGVIEANRTTNGIGWKEIAALGAVIGAGALFTGKLSMPTPPPTPPPAAASPADSNYEIRFFNRDGEPIDVPHISKRPQ